MRSCVHSCVCVIDVIIFINRLHLIIYDHIICVFRHWWIYATNISRKGHGNEVKPSISNWNEVKLNISMCKHTWDYDTNILRIWSNNLYATYYEVEPLHWQADHYWLQYCTIRELWFCRQKYGILLHCLLPTIRIKMQFKRN